MDKLGRLRLVGAAAAVSALGAPLAAQAAQRPIGNIVATAGTTGTVGHVGRWFTDSLGRVLVFHGGNVSDKNTAQDYSSYGIGTPDAAFMAGVGFNAIRLTVLWSAIEPKPGVYDDAYLKDVLKTQQAFWKYGIYSLIDSHQDSMSAQFGGEGFPDWAVLTSGEPNVPGLVNPAEGTAWDNFWNNAPGPGGVGIQDRYDAMWQHVTTFFRNKPGVFGYDILNEPQPGISEQAQCDAPNGCPQFDIDTLAPFYRKAITAIRAIDASTLIQYEPDANWNLGMYPSWIPGLGDPNVVFSYHPYAAATASPFSDAPPGDSRDQEAQVAADRSNAPAFQGERFGVNLADADTAMQGWTYWDYWDSGSTAAQSRNTSNYDTNPANGYVRPYPQATAGTPTGWSFDTTTKTFTFTYKTTQPDGAFGTAPTEVFLPSLIYTNGYTIALQGAKVIKTSKDGQVLSIQADTGATAVTLTVTAK